MRDIAAFHHGVVRALRRAGEEASGAVGPEDAIWMVTKALPQILGDTEAHVEPGNLKPGEEQQFACCCFMATADRKFNVLLAPVNFAPQQRHQKIDIGLGHPGTVIRNREPMLLANTDTHQSFVKILETFRAGSAVFAPVMWRGEAHGVIVCAAQARNTFSAVDLEVHVAFSHLVAALWMAHDGPTYLSTLAT